MDDNVIAAEALRRFIEQAFAAAGYGGEPSAVAADVLMWASLRGVDTHGVRNLKTYYIDRTLSGELLPGAEIRIEHATDVSARLDGGSGLGLVGAARAMEMAIEMAQRGGVGVVAVRNTHHLGPAGYFTHLAAERGLLGACATGHFFGRGHAIGIAPWGCATAMFSTNPVSFAAPCGAYPPLVLDMSTAVATVNRIQQFAQHGRLIPPGWASDQFGNMTTNPTDARLLWPLGGTAELGAYKGGGLAMIATVLSGVLSGAWAAVAPVAADAQARGDRSTAYEQPTMGHFFAAMQVELIQPRAEFESAMEAMIDALHAAPVLDGYPRLQYPGEPEHATALMRASRGIPVSDFVWSELQAIAERFGLALPPRRASARA
ncbi:MAG: hypothetical protein DCC67_19285 [Planctomycetota bacterium]|nr:MAG: hypothetical protein DCC67_19285 [Planctomycetota bacterium]